MATANTPKHLFADMLERVRAATAPLLPAGTDLARIVVEPPRDPAHGDMATNAALVFAKEFRKNPRELAEPIVRDFMKVALADKPPVPERSMRSSGGGPPSERPSASGMPMKE